MRTDRRGFLGGLLALAVAPRAVVEKVPALGPQPWSIVDAAAPAIAPPVIRPVTTIANLAGCLKRTYSRPYFEQHERMLSKFYDEAE